MVGRRAAVLGVAAAAVASTLWLSPFASAVTRRSAPVTIQISLTRERVGAGTSISGTATVTNLTSRPILVNACANDGWLFVGIVNHFVTFDPPVATAYCAPSVRLAPGPNRFPITVRTTYLSCTNRGPQEPGPRCTPKGPPPLPDGYYDTKAIIYGLPKGTAPPDAVAVTVLPKPTLKVGSSIALKGVTVTLDRIFLLTEEFRRKMNAEGIPLGVTRIGVNTGIAAVGNFGSSDRFSYTASGDAVNASSRLEGLNKHFGTRLCVGNDARMLCKGVTFRPIGSVTLKGKTAAVDVWEPLHEGACSADFLARYEIAFAATRERKTDAADLFSHLAAEAPQDPVVHFYLERLHAGETGVEIKMTEK